MKNKMSTWAFFFAKNNVLLISDLKCSMSAAFSFDVLKELLLATDIYWDVG